MEHRRPRRIKTNSHSVAPTGERTVTRQSHILQIEGALFFSDPSDAPLLGDEITSSSAPTAQACLASCHSPPW
jgi:hypothetical protein